MDGLIPDATYKYWMSFRAKEAASSEDPAHWPLHVIKYTDGLKLAKEYAFEEAFVVFMEMLFAEGVDKALQYARQERTKKHPFRYFVIWSGQSHLLAMNPQELLPAPLPLDK